MASNSGENDPTSSSTSNVGRSLVGRGGRLPSLRPTRDLTLGGVAKKSFMPSIPVRNRDKSKDTPSKPQKTVTFSPNVENKDRGAAGRGRGRGRGRAREIIQTQGSIFAEGPSERKSTRSRPDFGPSLRGSTSEVSSKTPSKKGKVHKDRGDIKFPDFAKDDFIEWDEDGEIGIELPIGLSVKSNSACKKEKKLKIEPSNGVQVKAEKMEVVDNKRGVAVKQELIDAIEEKVKLETEIKNFEEMTIADVFSSVDDDEDGLIFIQMPEFVPVLTMSRDDIKPKVGNVQGASNQNTQTIEMSKGLLDTEEGFAGKLQVLKSGKVRLILGNVTLNVEMGAQITSLEDLISLNCDESLKTGEMTVVGHIGHKIVLSPNLDTILS